MSKDDIVGGLGLALSSALAFLGFLWNIGILQTLFTFLIGAFATYIVQNRLQAQAEKRKTKRENAIVMRDTIYGPILMALSQIMEKIRSGEAYFSPSVTQDLDNVMNHYLFYMVSKDLKDRLYDLSKRVEKYEAINLAATNILNDSIKEKANRIYGIDIGSQDPWIRIKLGNTQVEAISLKQTLHTNMTPSRFVENGAQKWGESISVDISISGTKENELSKFESLYELVLDDMRKTPLYVEERRQNTRLIEELEGVISQIKVLVNFE